MGILGNVGSNPGIFPSQSIPKKPTKSSTRITKKYMEFRKYYPGLPHLVGMDKSGHYKNPKITSGIMGWMEIQRIPSSSFLFSAPEFQETSETHPHPGIPLGTRPRKSGKGPNSSWDFHQSHPVRPAHPLLRGKDKERLIFGNRIQEFLTPNIPARVVIPFSSGSLQNPNSFFVGFKGF